MGKTCALKKFFFWDTLIRNLCLADKKLINSNLYSFDTDPDPDSAF